MLSARRGLRRAATSAAAAAAAASSQQRRALVSLVGKAAATASSSLSSPPPASAAFHRRRRPLVHGQQLTRGFKYHETGWWEDQDKGGVTDGQPIERNPDMYKSLLAYVSDARKEEIYRLHKLEPDVFEPVVLSYLFNLSRARITAIIGLKGEEVRRRLHGRLYTEEDDIFDDPDTMGQQPKKAPAGSKKQAQGGGGAAAPPKPADPSELLLLDEESGLETLEDLTRPPGWEPMGKELLPLQAALQQAQIVEQLGLEGDKAEAALKPFKEKVDDAQLEELLVKLDEEMARVQADTEEAMYGATPAYEEKGMDEVPDPLNGFRMLERREAEVLETPEFLQYHAWMGLEQERLELLLAHLRAKHKRQAVTPYELKELEQAMEQYGKKRERCVALFARLRPLHEKRVAAQAPAAAAAAEGEKKEEKEDDEAKQATTAALVQEEKALLKKIKQELGPRIVDMEELGDTRARVVREIHAIAAHQRRSLLVQGLKAENTAIRKEKLGKYMELLREEAQSALDGALQKEDSVFGEVQWEVLQQHRRLLRQDDAGTALYASVGNEEAHAVLEQEVMDAIFHLSEAQVKDLHKTSPATAQSQQEGLRKVLATTRGNGERQAALQAYVKALFAEFSWASSSSSSAQDAATVSRRAYELFLGDIHESVSLRDGVNPMEVAAELRDLLPAGADDAVHQAMVDCSSGGGGVSLPHRELREAEIGYQQHVAADLAKLKAARVTALRSSRKGGAKGGDEKAMRRYLVLAAVASRLDAFDRVNQSVLTKILQDLLQAFRGKQEVVAAAYKLLVEELYTGQEIDATAIAEVAKLVGRTEDWVGATLVKLMKSGTQETAYANPADIARQVLNQDCFTAGIRSAAGLKKVREELLGAASKLTAADVEAVEDEFGFPVDVEEAQDLLAGALDHPIGTHTEPSALLADALWHKDAPIEDRARAAKALLERLRLEPDYQAYVAPIRDRIVEEIEEELLDTVYDMSDELRTEIDPVLVDLKPKEHYDIPSLKFRVLNDNETAASDGVRDGFVEEEADETDVAASLWRPHDELRDFAASAASKKGQVGGSGEGVQQRRWSFAFKDTALPGGGKSGAQKGGTVIRDKTGRLRAASPGEEQARSWMQRRRRVVVSESD